MMEQFQNDLYGESVLWPNYSYINISVGVVTKQNCIAGCIYIYIYTRSYMFCYNDIIKTKHKHMLEPA